MTDATLAASRRAKVTKPFRGTYTVLITPFTPDGEAVDIPALARLVEFQIANGVDGLIPLGSTGEFLSISRDERAAVVDCVVKTAAGRVPVLIGTGAEDTREVVALSREAEAQGADGVMIIPPFYSVPTLPELLHHYGRVADAIGIPIMVYNNPATANVDLTPIMLSEISRIPNCRYVKESTLEVTRVRDIVALCGDRMEVFAGVLGYESAWLGAIGWVAVCSNVAPRLSRDMFWKAAFVGAVGLFDRHLVVKAVGNQELAHFLAAAEFVDEGLVQPGLVDLQARIGEQSVAVKAFDVVALEGAAIAPDVDIVLFHGGHQHRAGDCAPERGGVEVGDTPGRDVKGAALDCGNALVRQLAAAVDQTCFLRAVGHGLARNFFVVGLVGLAQVGGVGIGQGAFLLHPQKGCRCVEAAREGDAHFLPFGQVLQDGAHVRVGV